MDEKFKNLAVIANGSYVGAGGKTVTVRVDANVRDLFLTEKTDSGDTESFDIAFARSIVNRAGDAEKIVIAENGKPVFTAELDKTRKDHHWNLVYQPSGKIAFEPGQDHPESVTWGKPENGNFDRDEARKYAVNTLKIGLRAYGVYIPRESFGVETPVEIPADLQTAIDAIPADLPGRDKIVADLLKTVSRGIKAEIRADKVKTARKAKKANTAN